MFATTSRESIGINWNLCYQEHLKQKLDEIGVKDLPPLHCLTIVKLRLGRPETEDTSRTPSIQMTASGHPKRRRPWPRSLHGPRHPIWNWSWNQSEALRISVSDANSNTPDHEKKTSALPRKRFNAFRKARNKKIQKESEFQIFQRTKNRVVIVTAFVQIGQGRGRPWRLPVKAINRSKRSSTVRAQVALAFTALKGPARSPNCQRFLPLLWNLVPVHSNHTSTVLV